MRNRKAKTKTSVRAIGIGDALKGVIPRAHCDQIRQLVSGMVEPASPEDGMASSSFKLVDFAHGWSVADYDASPLGWAQNGLGHRKL